MSALGRTLSSGVSDARLLLGVLLRELEHLLRLFSTICRTSSSRCSSQLSSGALGVLFVSVFWSPLLCRWDLRVPISPSLSSVIIGISPHPSPAQRAMGRGSHRPPHLRFRKWGGRLRIFSLLACALSYFLTFFVLLSVATLLTSSL